MNSHQKLVLCSAMLLCWIPAGAQGSGDVTAKFTVAPHSAATARKSARQPALNDIVLWLTRDDDAEPMRNPLPKTGYKMVQKDKMFMPHLLVVPAGSSIDFPNLDPFFHNVFSMFNGKRFDLGLYEAGAHKSVKFDREGVSYIFCNIHPEMGAIVLALNSPYFAVSGADGMAVVHDVPPGKYRIHIWSEQFQSGDPGPDRGSVQVTAQGASLGVIELTPAASPLINHKNKFGEDYPATPAPTY